MKTQSLLISSLVILGACSSPVPGPVNRTADPVHVTTVTVRQEKVSAVLRYSGTVEAFQTIPLTFKTAGTVEKVLAEAGDIVKKGQLLATIDETDAKSMYNITSSQYQQAKDAWDRLKTVHDNGSLADIKWVEMESKLEQAKSSLDLAKNNLDKCKMYAPADGMVGRRNIEPGMSSIAIASAPIELVEISQVYVKIAVPENEIARFARGQAARFNVQALGDRTFEGRVTVISPVADRISRTYEVKILLPNPGMALKPGMVCDVSMDQAAERELTLVPNQCVTMDFEHKAYVFVVDPKTNTVSRRVIRTGQYMDSGLEVVSGLQPGEMIVSEGKEKLSDQCKISL